MKKFLYTFCTFFAAVLIFNSCEKEEEYVPEEPQPRLNGEGYLLKDNERYELNCYYLHRMGATTWSLSIENEETESEFYCLFWTTETQVEGTYNFSNLQRDFGSSWYTFGNFKHNNIGGESITIGTMTIYPKMLGERKVYQIEVDASSPQHNYKLEFTAKQNSFLGFPDGVLY